MRRSMAMVLASCALTLPAVAQQAAPSTAPVPSTSPPAAKGPSPHDLGTMGFKPPVKGERIGLDLPVAMPVFNPNAGSSPQNASTPNPGSLRTLPVDIRRDERDRPDPVDEPPPTFFGETITAPGDSIVFVIDISGSMSLPAGNPFTNPDGILISGGSRLDLAKAELLRSIYALAPSIRFNVVAYDCVMRTWSSTLRNADDDAKRSAGSWVGALLPGLATGTGPATAVALAFRDNQVVVLLTDGEPTCGSPGVDYISEHRTLIRKENVQGARVDVFGIGADGPYRSFCQGVASDNGGSYFDVR